MRRQRGGKKWKEGVDGCIFYPAVSCQGDSPTSIADMDKVSKIIPKDSVDERVENFIATHFPHVVEGKGVLIAERRCTPQFKTSDLIIPLHMVRNPTSPCKLLQDTKPELYTNFVTEKYDDKNYYQTVQEEPYKSDNDLKLKLLRRALNAAVALVPDSGPWVLGFDFHIGNILVMSGAEPYSSLADWGRTIIIENPNDPVSIRRGIRQGMYDLRASGWQSKYTDTQGRIIEEPLRRFENYPEVPQFTQVVRKSLNRVYQEAVKDKIDINIASIRIMNVYGILSSLISSGTISFSDITKLNHDVYNAMNQQNLIDALNNNISVPGISKYIDIDTLFPKASRAVPASALGAGAGTALGAGPVITTGGKGTRKQKKTLKKRSKRQTRR